MLTDLEILLTAELIGEAFLSLLGGDREPLGHTDRATVLLLQSHPWAIGADIIESTYRNKDQIHVSDTQIMPVTLTSQIMTLIQTQKPTPAA